MKFAIVNSTTLKIVNMCEWEGAEWLPPVGTYIVQTDTARIGDTYDPVFNTFILEPAPVDILGGV